MKSYDYARRKGRFGETLRLVAERCPEKGSAEATTAVLASHSWARPKADVVGLETDELLMLPWDTLVLVEGKWKLHPELEQAIDLAAPKF